MRWGGLPADSLFTSDQLTPRQGARPGRRLSVNAHDFEGFGDESEIQRNRDMALRKRLIDMEREMKMVKARMDKLEDEVASLKIEKDVWKDAYNDLHKQMCLNEKKTDNTVEEVNVQY